MGFSGETKGTYYAGGDFYTLKIIDMSSRICLNDTLTTTRQLLNNLGLVLELELSDKLGDRICAGRQRQPHQKFNVKEELLPLIGEGVYGKIASYITVYGHPNNQVIIPKPLGERPAYLVGQPLRIGSDIFAWSQLNPGPIALTTRTPININTASQPVLTAVLANLEGVYLSQAPDKGLKPLIPFVGNNVTTSGQAYYYPWQSLDELINADKRVPGPKIGTVKNARLDLALAVRLVHRIIQARQQMPFLTWQQFNAFCDRLVAEGFFGTVATDSERELAQARADLVKANANPNSLFNKFNPNEVVARLVDKSDLTSYTTEFCLQSSGLFEIEALGLVTQKVIPFLTEKEMESESIESEQSDSQIVFAHQTRTVIDLGVQAQETTQADFKHGSIASSIEETTLQTYPDINEACPADGQILLATNQSTKSSGTIFQNHFTKNFKADYAAGNPEVIVENESGDTSGNPVKQSFGRPHAGGILDKSVLGPGSLYPDGAYSEMISCLCYDAKGNFPDSPPAVQTEPQRFRGAMTFWWKPNYTFFSSKPRVVFSATKSYQNIFEVLAFPNNYPADEYVPSPLQTENTGQLVWLWSTGSYPDNKQNSYIVAVPLANVQPHQWIHLGIAWDTIPAKGLPETCVYCGGVGRISLVPQASTEKIQVTCRQCNGSGIQYRYTGPQEAYTLMINGQDTSQSMIYPSVATHLKSLNLSENNSIRLGERFARSFWNSSGDFTIDEFTVHVPDHIAQAKEIIWNDFRKGRYYQGQGVFTSGLIEIPLNELMNQELNKEVTSALKGLVVWTVYYPEKWDIQNRKVEIQLLNEQSEPITAVLSDDAGTEIALPLKLILEKGVSQDKKLKLKYRVIFRAGQDELNQPLLTSPVLDDITLTLMKAEPRILEWYVIP